MRGYPQFSFWISIILGKIYLSCIIINRGKNTFELVGTVLKLEELPTLLKNRRLQDFAILRYKVKNELCPSYIKEIFQNNNINHYSFRNSEFVIPVVRRATKIPNDMTIRQLRQYGRLVCNKCLALAESMLRSLVRTPTFLPARLRFAYFTDMFTEIQVLVYC